MSFPKDSRRSDKFKRHKKRFQSHPPRTRKDAKRAQECRRSAEDRGESRREYRETAQETLRILKDGYYHDPGTGDHVSLIESLQAMRDGTVLYRPDADVPVPAAMPNPPCATVFEVALESTLAGAHRLVQEHGYERVVALNFASAKHPGGGFATGAQAQEETLARASTLYASIGDDSVAEMYQYNVHDPNNGLYSHYMIYTPRAVVFRDDKDDSLLPSEQLYHVSFITSPAVNATVAQHRINTQRIDAVMAERIDRILSIAAQHGYPALVLGAYGCGVFGNDLRAVGCMFMNALRSERFHGRFEYVLFASIGERDVEILKQLVDGF